MRITTISAIALLLAAAPTNANLPEDPAEYAAWEAGMLKSIGQLTSTWNEKTVASLGRTVGQLSEERSPNWEKGERPVFHAAQAALLAIPGHAEYYRDRINEARRLLDETPYDDIALRGPRQGDLRNEQMYGFQTLSHLPSAETVRVLGEFLFDERVSNPPVPLESTNAGWAARSLGTLPLASRPITSENPSYQDAPTWRLWYQQVKAGTRTFRFVGDPKEYNLRDLIRQQSVVDSTARPPRHATGDRPPVATVADAAPASGSSGALPILIAAGLAVLAALWYFLRARKSRRI